LNIGTSKNAKRNFAVKTTKAISSELRTTTAQRAGLPDVIFSNRKSQFG
jgi:hypothetical protein